MTSLVERLVPDELWALFRRVVPPTAVIRPQGGGRRRADDREALAAIIFVATSGCTWRQLPPVFGPAWITVYRRFAQWSRERVWAKLHRVILDLLVRSALNRRLSAREELVLRGLMAEFVLAGGHAGAAFAAGSVPLTGAWADAVIDQLARAWPEAARTAAVVLSGLE